MSTDNPSTPPPAAAPTPAPRPRKSFGATVKSRKRAQQIDDARDSALMRVLTAEVIDSEPTNSAKLLTSHDTTRPLGSTPPSSSRMNNYARGQLIRQARARLNASADRLVQNQLAIIDRGLALAGTDAKYLDVARRAVESLMAAINDDGERLITKEQHDRPPASTIQIGIALGGLPQTPKRIDE